MGQKASYIPPTTEDFLPRRANPLFTCWRFMLRRCEDKRDEHYQDYGGRGIYVHPRWKTFEHFVSDVGQKPFPGLELDRIDNDGPYAPGNVQWSTRKQQTRNTRRNRWLTYQGETKCLAEWEEITGIPQRTLRNRLINGWSPEATIETPVKLDRWLTYQGLTLTPQEWADRLGIRRGVIYARLQKGWTIDRVLSARLIPRRENSPKCLLTFQGETQTLTAWAKRVGISMQAIRQRLNLGWTVERALTTAGRAQQVHELTWNGETKGITAWSNLTGLPRDTIIGRLKMGWPVERILTEPPSHRSRRGNPSGAAAD